MPAQERRIGWIGPRYKYWSWILARLPQIEYLDDWTEWQTDSDRDILLVALENRVSSEWDRISEIWQSISNAGVAASSPKKNRRKIASQPTVLDANVSLLLGESWPGHRRTFPIPETIRTFYWYELYDRLLPSLDLGMGMSDFQAPDRGQRVVRWQSTVEQLKRLELSGKRILVVADSSTTHDLWLETLGDRYGSALGVDSEQLGRFRYHADMVLIDFDPHPCNLERPVSDAHHQRVTTTLKQVRRRFPEAMTVVADSFPRWIDWEAWSLAGADLLFPKPGCLLGLAWGLKRWEEMSLAE